MNEIAITMNALEPEGFPILMGVAQSHARTEREFRDGLMAVSTAVTSGSGMRKVAHDDLKHVFSRLVERAWERNVSTVFTVGRFDTLPASVQELYWSVSHSSLHDMLSAKKKLDKTAANGPAVDAMRALVNEVHPLAEAMSGLKAHLIKGRAPPDPEKVAAAANPDKITKTCACCFRAVALSGQTMAHHGYQRPGDGNQTASCGGVQFKPLEVSSAGLQWVLNDEKARLARFEAAFAQRESLTSLSRVRNRVRVEVKPGDSEWSLTFRSHVANLESEIRYGTRTVQQLQAKLDGWVQTEPDGLSSVRKPRGSRQP